MTNFSLDPISLGASLFKALGSWGRAKASEKKKNEGGLSRGTARDIFTFLHLFYTLLNQKMGGRGPLKIYSYRLSPFPSSLALVLPHFFLLPCFRLSPTT